MGITKYAADALGDIVHVDLPGEDDSFSAGESIVSVVIPQPLSLPLIDNQTP